MTPSVLTLTMPASVDVHVTVALSVLNVSPKVFWAITEIGIVSPMAMMSALGVAVSLLTTASGRGGGGEGMVESEQAPSAAAHTSPANRRTVDMCVFIAAYRGMWRDLEHGG
jgi:hypothetical protein